MGSGGTPGSSLKIITYLHHRYCHSCALVNQVRSECARLLLRVTRDHWPVWDHQCPQFQCPASHPHPAWHNDAHCAKLCGRPSIRSSGFSKCWYNWSCEEVQSRHKDGDEYIFHDIFFVPSCARNLAIVSVLGMGRYNILNIHLISISLKLNE